MIDYDLDENFHSLPLNLQNLLKIFQPYAYTLEIKTDENGYYLMYIPKNAQSFKTLIYSKDGKIYVETPISWTRNGKVYETNEGIRRAVCIHSILILSLTKLQEKYAKSRRYIPGIPPKWKYKEVPEVIQIA